MRIQEWEWPTNYPILEKWYEGQYPNGYGYYKINWENIFKNRF